MAWAVFDLGFPLDPGATSLSQVAMWLGQYAVEARLDGFVADRTLLDVAIHCALLADRTGEARDRYIAYAIINATASTLQNRYDVIFYLPVEFPIADDGVRSTSTGFRSLLDGKTVEMLKDFGMPWCTFHGSLEERVESGIAALEAVGLGRATRAK